VTVQTDFAPLYARLATAADIPIAQIERSDQVFTRGTQAYALAGGRAA
jgi:phenylalanine-4-hydroxylase